MFSMTNDPQHQTAQTNRLPPWIRVRAKADAGKYRAVHDALRAAELPTVCESAHCPNRMECFNNGVATVMILGDICTRDCRFCAVKHGVPRPPPENEPERVKQLAIKLGLKYVVVTSVTRDDLPDGGAAVFAGVIRALKTIPARVETLTPDFQGRAESIATVLAAAPDVFNHNLETVRRLQPQIRPQADYEQSLRVLQMAADMDARIIIKSGLMLGLGETGAELLDALADLRRHKCATLTMGQYLPPSRRHYPVARHVTPSEFDDYRDKALGMGFTAVASGPLVRSSYHAEELANIPARQLQGDIRPTGAGKQIS